MNFRLGEAVRKFAGEVRQFLTDEPPESFPCEAEDEGYGFGAWSYAYNRRLGEKGWISGFWPTESYGQGWSETQLFVLMRELASCCAPAEAYFYTQTVCTVLINMASVELKNEVLPGAASGELTFWEGFSEPESGSDLLSLRTSAREDGDDYVINGQKVWNSNAHLANYGYTAARTDPDAPRHKGISLFLIDMSLPGVTANPLDEMSGGQAFSEVFFDDVRVPKKFLLGEKNKGLPLLLHGLDWDRFWGRCVKAPYLRFLLDKLIQYCKETNRKGRPLTEDLLIRNKLADMAVQTEVCDLMFQRILSMRNRNLQTSAEASEAKLFADELGQRFSELAMQILGSSGQLKAASNWAPLEGIIERDYLSSLGHTLAGGTSEIQRNTIATRGLGLPRE